MIVLALTGLASAADIEIPFERYELDNGLDVILAPDDSTPIVHVNVWYHVGSKDETKGLTGFAHLFEHLMFNGSHSAPGDFFEPLQEVGADLNGTTNVDRTNYFETLPSQHLPLALFMESDRMGWLLPALNIEKLDNQRDVVRNERRQRYENPPYGEAHVDLMASMYPDGHPYQHTTIGSHEDLENASLEDVVKFFETWYAPNNASLVIAGSFDADATKKMVKEQFGSIPRGSDVTHGTAEMPKLDASKEIRQYQKVPHKRFWLAWHTPAFYADGDAELDILSSVLSDGKDSRLQKELVRDKRIARNIAAYQASNKLSSYYIITGTAAEGHTTDEIVAEVDRILKDVVDGSAPPTPEEVDAGVAGFEKGFYQRITTISGKGNLLNQYNYYTGDPGFIGKDLDRYLGMEPDAVAAAGKQWLLGTNRVALHIWPEEDKPADAAATEEDSK